MLKRSTSAGELYQCSSRPLGKIFLRYCLALVLCLSVAGFSLLHDPHNPAQGSSHTSKFSPNDSLFNSVEDADKFLRQVFTSMEAQLYEDAVAAYFFLLDQIDNPRLTSSDASVITRHLRGLSIVMPAQYRQEIGLGSAQSPFVIDSLQHNSSQYIKRWWRSQDNLPATAINERLYEHLTRYFEAHKQYKNNKDLRGFDDRGEIYVRLGDPSKKTKLRILAPSYTTNSHGFRLPDNEFWVYQHIGYDAQYLFIEHTRKKGHTVSLPSDLIPKRIQNSRRHAPILLEWMEELYGQLALLHNAYGQRYDEVLNYISLRPPGSLNPDAFARTLFHNAHSEDLQMEWQRQQTTPLAHSNAQGTVERIPVSLRLARFLDADGSTRAEVDWIFSGSALRPSRRIRRQLYKEGHEPSDKYLVTASLADRNMEQETKSILQKSYLIPETVQDQLQAETFTVTGKGEDFNLAFQLDARWTLNNATKDNLLPGARVKIATMQIDSIATLSNDPGELVISDIRPLRMRPDQMLEQAQPFPQRQLTQDIPLALYFEVYNLTFDANELTRLAVEYEIVRRSEGGLLRKAGKVKSRNTISTEYVGESRTAKEYIIPDLEDWSGSGEIEIILTVADEQTGRQASRAISFLVEDN